MPIIGNLIDADVCTYNSDYRKRILSIIDQYGDLIRENAKQDSLSTSQKYLLELFTKKVIKQQQKIVLSKDVCKMILDEVAIKAQTFPECDGSLENYIFCYIQYLEKIASPILREVYLAANCVMVSIIKRQINHNKKVVLMLGSNRQTPADDRHNAATKGTASIFFDLKNLAQYLEGVGLDTTTLVDAYNDHPDGSTNFERILRQKAASNKSAFDDSKINIVYMAAHRLTSKHSNDEVILNMWDDNKIILGYVKDFFSAHPDLLPKGLKLQLYRYDGKVRSVEVVAVGTGKIDRNYRASIRLMGDMCGHNEQMPVINIAKKLNVEDFLQKRVVEVQAKLQANDAKLFKMPVLIGKQKSKDQDSLKQDAKIV